MKIGRERLEPRHAMPRHRHARGYVAIVLSGSYVEAGDEGRRRVVAGDALVHTAFDAHVNVIGPDGAEVLNLPLPDSRSFPAAFRVRDPDGLARAAESGPEHAATLLDIDDDGAPLLEDWPDHLAAALRSRPSLRLDRWASEHRLARETVSRGFRAVFGVSPSRFRADVRARRAFERIVRSDEPLAAIAYLCGFADQAHLSRAIAELTGLPPTAWRRTSNRFKTDAIHPS